MKRQWIVTFIAAFVLLGCSKNGFGGSSTNASSSDSSAAAPQPPTTPTPPVTPDPNPTADPYAAYESYIPLAWEKSAASTRAWSLYLFSVIDTQTSSLLGGTSDIANFCPKYSSLNRDGKIQFWAYLFSAVARYESGFDPLSRMKENLGTDPITHQQVQSEGLLQLSYQDILNYPTCRMDWNADKNLSPTDPRKTILDPDINLQCAAIIMSKQVKNHNKIVISSGAYWSTLQSSSRYNQIAAITKATQALPFCN